MPPWLILELVSALDSIFEFHHLETLPRFIPKKPNY
jgi:hypothetical protein